jgi:hypothetical protein
MATFSVGGGVGTGVGLGLGVTIGLGRGDACGVGLAGFGLGSVVLLVSGVVHDIRANAAAATHTVARMAGSLMTGPQL